MPRSLAGQIRPRLCMFLDIPTQPIFANLQILRILSKHTTTIPIYLLSAVVCCGTTSGTSLSALYRLVLCTSYLIENLQMKYRADLVLAKTNSGELFSNHWYVRNNTQDTPTTRTRTAAVVVLYDSNHPPAEQIVRCLYCCCNSTILQLYALDARTNLFAPCKRNEQINSLQSLSALYSVCCT